MQTSLAAHLRSGRHLALVAVLLPLATAVLIASASQFVVTSGTGVVLQPSATPDIRLTCGRGFPSGLSGSWQPTPADLKPLEAALPVFLEARIPPERRPLVAAIHIYRQYVGMYRAGRPQIYVNGFESERDKWQTETLVVCDGGPTNFGALFDVERGRFTEFYGNESF